MEKLETKMDGLKELFNERFSENTKEHTAIWEQVKSTNGRVRLLERAMWAVGGGLAVMALLFSPQAVQTVINLIR